MTEVDFDNQPSKGSSCGCKYDHLVLVGRELRCPCGSLIARLEEDGLMLKCRRCKRLLHAESHLVELPT